MKTLKTVWQAPNSFHCGTACFAMLADVSFDIAKSVLFGERNITTIGRKALLKGLQKYSIVEIGSGRFTKKLCMRDLPNHALVKGCLSDESNDREWLHWVVWDAKQKVMRDPDGFQLPFRATSYTTLDIPRTTVRKLARTGP